MLTAFGYQVVFQKPVSDIFPGLYHAVEAGVEERLEEFDREFNDSAARGRAALTAVRDVGRIREEEQHKSA